MLEKRVIDIKQINFGQIIKEERQKQGISRFALAYVTGFTERAIAYWEDENRDIKLEHAHKIAKVLGIAVTIGKIK